MAELTFRKVCEPAGICCNDDEFEPNGIEFNIISQAKQTGTCLEALFWTLPPPIIIFPEPSRKPWVSLYRYHWTGCRYERMNSH